MKVAIEYDYPRLLDLATRTQVLGNEHPFFYGPVELRLGEVDIQISWRHCIVQGTFVVIERDQHGQSGTIVFAAVFDEHVRGIDANVEVDRVTARLPRHRHAQSDLCGIERAASRAAEGYGFDLAGVGLGSPGGKGGASQKTDTFARRGKPDLMLFAIAVANV